MNDEMFDRHILVGGTSLALQLGHRLSIDIDLFTEQEFDSQALDEHLTNSYPWKPTNVGPNLLMGFVGSIKVDLVRHNYPLVSDLVVKEGIRMASILDIGAVKFNAIAHSGQRQKDFYDMYTLLEHHCLDDLTSAYVMKYSNANQLMATRSLTYFDDIDFDREPAMMAKPVAFEAVRERLRTAVLEPYRTF